MMHPAKQNKARVFSTMSGETIVFLVLFFSIALAGFNSGNNLLYLVSGVMLAGILVSAAAGYLNLARVSVSRRLPPYVFSDQACRMILEVTNRKKRFHSYGVKIVDGSAQERAVFVPFVRKNEKYTTEIKLQFGRRGLYRFDSIIISSRFPWGLFDLKRKKSGQQDLIVYPAIYEIRRIISGSSRIRDEFPQFTKGPGSGLYGVREYRHGEDISNISWKLSAKMDKLIVRETEAEERRRVCIVFDNVLDDFSEAGLESFERTVSAAASVIWYLCRNGYVVKLVTRDRIIPYGGGSEQMHKMLIVLALIEPVSPEDTGYTPDKRLLEGGTGVLVRNSRAKQAPRPADKDFAVIISEAAGGISR
ncbi:MAG: DUF58 domain-containing protein [Candidatus Abyssobacteria bacterium SURF_5]|uniref:DUF58 domain-containing protein n=1 Tax=Abyssobacteria bacterium (strain SURF_5) TaxID=2093360 RepID=A0A3A4P1Q4_ABYX5|nr:MAG: DUF58 domain-containing protein [Candidatus Abyssubacteria bacterium SURF_5]